MGRSSTPQATPALGNLKPLPFCKRISDTWKRQKQLPIPEPASRNLNRRRLPPDLNYVPADSLTTNLLSSWVQKKATLGSQGASSPSPSGPQDPDEGDDSSHQEPTTGAEGSSIPVEAEPGSSTAHTPEPVSLEEDTTSRRVRDFHSRLDELGQKPPETGLDSDEEDTHQRSTSPSTTHGDLPGFRSASSLFHSRKRASPDVATVTIGDQTVTSLIGSSAKRRREDSSPTSTRAVGSTPREPKPFAAPSFGGRLSQLFSANSQEEDVSERRRDEEQDSIKDSDMDEDSNVKGDTHEGGKPDQSDVSSDDGYQEIGEMADGERATSPARFQALDMNPEDGLREPPQDDATEGQSEEPAPRDQTCRCAFRSANTHGQTWQKERANPPLRAACPRGIGIS